MSHSARTVLVLSTVMAKRVFFLFAIATAVFWKQAVAATKMTYADYCLKEAGVTQEFVDSIQDDSTKEPTEDFYCYLKCIFTGMGILDEDGVIQKDVLKVSLEMDAECLKGVSKVVECSDMKAFDDCETD